MAILTQRLIIIIIFINLMIGIAHGVYENPTNAESTTMADDILVMQGHVEDLHGQDEYSSSKRDNLENEASIGNQLSLGKIFWDVLWGGLYPFSFTRVDFDTAPEKAIADMLVLFRTVMGILVGLELYLVIKNRKT